METLTFRFVFEKSVLQVLHSEDEFKHNIPLSAKLTASEHFIAIFVYRTEPTLEGTRTLEIASTTIAPIQRYSLRRMAATGIYLLRSAEEHGLAMHTIRAHFRAARHEMYYRLASQGGRLLRWQDSFRNGAGDMEQPAYVIRDPDLEGLERLFGEDTEGSEHDQV